MNALALALALALGPEGFEEDRLPRSLSDSFDAPVADADLETHGVFVGIHLGAAGALEGEHPAFVAGFEWRIHILPWLASSGSIDYQTKEQVDNLIGAHFLQIPITWSLLLSPPIDLGPLRPYGQGGVGATITDISGSLQSDAINLNLLYTLGFGLEVELGSDLLLNVDCRYVWAKDPPGAIGYGGDWRQFTVGLLLKLPN